MANGIYKLTSHIRYLGQQLVNTFWYRSVLEGTFATDLLIDGAHALGTSFIENVWQHSWRNQMPSDLYFDNVMVMGYNDQFELLYNNTIAVTPTTQMAVGAGEVHESKLPLGVVANMAFYLKNRLIANPFLKPPSKGLVAISPLDEGFVGNDGTINDVGIAALTPIAQDFAKKLPWPFVDFDFPFTGWEIGVGLADAFVPIRAKTWDLKTPQVLGGVTILKHIETTDVEECVVRKVTGYRRSRKVEG